MLNRQQGLTNYLITVFLFLFVITFASNADDLTVTYAYSLYSGSESVAFSPDGKYIATGDVDGDVGLWEVSNGENIYYQSLGGTVQGVAFSPDGKYIAADGAGGGVRIILMEASDATEVDRLELVDEAHHIHSVAYSPDGRYIAIGDDTGRAYLWDVNSGRWFWWTFWQDELYSVAFSPNGVYLATGDSDGYARLWELNSWWTDDVNTIDFKPGGNVQAVAFSPDGRYLAADGYDGSNTYVNIYNMDTRRVAWQINSDDVYAIAFSPNGEYIALGDNDGVITFYSIGTNPTHVAEIAASDEVLDLAWSPDGTMISDGRDVWNVTQPVPTPPDNTDTNQDPDVTVSFSPSSVQSPTVGERLTLSLTITDGENVAGYQATVRFDTTALKYVQSANGDYLPDGAFFIPAVVDGNSVTLAASSLAGESNGDGTLATLTFEVLAVKTSTLTLSDVLLTDSAGGSSRPQVETTQITESEPSSDRISVVLSPDLISEVAFGPNSTYFVLNAQFPTLTGVDSTDVIYRDCTITLDLEGVPDNALSDSLLPNLLEYLRQAAKRVLPTDPVLFIAKEFAINSGILEVFPDEPQYFIFPLMSAAERAREVEKESDVNLLIAGVSTLAGLIPFAGDLLSLGVTFGSIEYKRMLAIDEILKSTMDPEIRLTSSMNDPGRPNDEDKYVLILPKRVTEIKIKVEQVYMLESDKGQLHTAPPYEGTYNLETNAFSAPSKQLMTISDYPPFQLLPQEVQDFLRNHFSDPMNAVGWHIPNKTSLLPNYPNPFNPETWIPYQLAAPMDVSISIYAADGTLVRTLDVGHQSVGIYESKNRAAYWDGRNALGEPVASGVYFYTLTAGEFSATRKMLIRK